MIEIRKKHHRIHKNKLDLIRAGQLIEDMENELGRSRINNLSKLSVVNYGANASVCFIRKTHPIIVDNTYIIKKKTNKISSSQKTFYDLFAHPIREIIAGALIFPLIIESTNYEAFEFHDAYLHNKLNLLELRASS